MERLKIRDIITFLETIAPQGNQESYDNCGLLTGNEDWTVTGILTTLDCTENVIDEAIDRKCNLIISHHPIIFKGLKKITGQNYVERTVIKSIKNDVAIYAIHTNLDNVYKGVNGKIAEKLRLINTRILSPKRNTLSKLVTFAPVESAHNILTALHHAGAGTIGKYKNCSFSSVGIGSFLPTGNANPAIGIIDKIEKVEEQRIEVLFPTLLENKILSCLKSAHPYEEVAYYISNLENENQEVGAGMVGELETSEEPLAFLSRLKSVLNTPSIRHTSILNKTIKKIALCGGSGSFLLQDAIRSRADLYISSDFKYHEFFDADNKIVIADIGHYESEQFTKELLKDVLTEKFPTFAINFSITPTNPISYL